MYDTLIFDLGGVVVNYDPKDYLVERFFYSRIEQKIYDAMFGSPEWRKLDLGEMTFDEASAVFMERALETDCEFEMRAVIEDWMDLLTDRRATINLMRLFKKRGYHLYYLSNISHLALAEVKKRKFWTLFDGGIASCEAGVCKPDIQIYKDLLERYDINPKNALFVDDSKVNAEAAFRAGITGIHFTNVNELIKTLLTYGIDLKKKP